MPTEGFVPPLDVDDEEPASCDLFEGVRRVGGMLLAVGRKQILFDDFAVMLDDEDTLVVHCWPAYNGLEVEQTVGKEHAQLKIKIREE